MSSNKYYPLLNASISDPKQTREVADIGPVIRGQNVTFTCSLTYYFKSAAGLQPRARVRPIFNWVIAGSTRLSKSETPLDDTSGETLQHDVWTMAIGTKVPSYNCSSVFIFFGVAHRPDVARNDVWWSCASEPVYTWCMYFKLL